jgi:hypothetical protein
VVPGDRGQQRVTTPEFAILTLLLLLGGGAFWYYQRASEAGRNDLAHTATTAHRDTLSGVKDARPSIAVLPFENRSRLEDDAFFVDGIHDDILTQLTKVGAPEGHSSDLSPPIPGHQTHYPRDR